jgi:hypothetical protein
VDAPTRHLLTQSFRRPSHLQCQLIELIDAGFDAAGRAIDVVLDLIDQVVDAVELVFEMRHGVSSSDPSASKEESSQVKNAAQASG